MKSILPLLILGIAATTSGVAQRDIITPSDNLVTEGIPKVPASLAEDVGRYGEFRSAEFASWHPTRREMLIRTRFCETTQLHQLKFPGGSRTQLTFFDDRVIGGSYEQIRGDYMVFLKDVGGNENFQFYRYEFATGKITLLTDGTSRNTGGVWSNAGDVLAYQSTRRNGKDVDIYMMNPSDLKSDHMVLQLQGGGWETLGWSPDDHSLLVGEYISINESYLWLVDATTGEKRLVTPKGGAEKVAYGGASFSKDGKGIYVTTDAESEFRRLAYIDLATMKHTFLTSDIPWDVVEFAPSRDRSMIAFVTNEDGLGVLRVLDLSTGKRKPLPKLPVGLISGLEWHKNGKDLSYIFASPRSASDVYSMNIETGAIDRWTYSESGGLNTEGFSEAELVHWKSFDGRTISGFLYRPPSTFPGKHPVVVMIHGGPESQAHPSFLGKTNYYLNELGAAVLYPNVRGSSGYGKTFLTLDNGFHREDSYKDIGALFDWIRTQPDLDPERIMVMGGSYGGHMTLAIASRYGDRIRCAVSVVGMSNLVTFLRHTSGYRADLRRAEYGDERDPKMKEFLERIAPLNNAGNITKPLFIIQGENDPRVPRSEAEQMVATLKSIGTPVWYLLARDEGHGFIKKKNQDYQSYATVLFMKQFLLNQ